MRFSIVRSMVLSFFIVAFLQGCLPIYFPALTFRRSSPVLIPKRSDCNSHHNVDVSFSNVDFLVSQTETNLSAAFGYTYYRYWKWFGFDLQSEVIAGSYDIINIQGYTGWKSYGGLNSSAFGGLRIGNDKVGFALGPQGSIQYEFGPYSNFRRDAKRYGLIDANDKDYSFGIHGILNLSFYTKRNVCIFFQGKGGIYELCSLIIGTTFLKNSIWISMMPPIDWPNVTYRVGFCREFGFH